MPQQRIGDQTNALLRPRRPHQLVGSIAVAAKRGTDLHRIELTRQNFAGLRQITCVAAIVELADKNSSLLGPARHNVAIASMPIPAVGAQ